MSDYFPRRSACDEETRAFSIDRTASAAPANSGAAYRGPSQGLAAMRDVVSPKRRFGSLPDLALGALMSASASSRHSVVQGYVGEVPCMDGARGAREKNLTFPRSVRVQPCMNILAYIRPLAR